MNTTPIRLFAATFCTALLFACGGGGGSSDPPVDQTPPTLTAQGATRAVVRKGDTTPLPASFAVTVGGNSGTGTVAWKDEANASRGSGNSLPLNTAVTALAAGEHTLTASITNAANGKSAETTFSLLVLAEGVDTDDDNDGLTYSQEEMAGTDPGNGDTDGDGLADGAEAGLGTDPTKADSSNPSNGVNDGVELGNLNGTGGALLPPRSLMAAEAGKSPGVSIGADGLSITFGDELNAACVNKTGTFTDAIYSGSATDASERCRKRAVRANVGVRPGEFRYFETRRFGGLGEDSLQNIGQGIITPSAQIDPYCCYIDPGDSDYTNYVDAGVSPPVPKAANITPPSMTVNSIGGVFVRLVQVDTAFSPGLDIDLSKTDFYGFAVDYRRANPLVYVVARDRNNALVVSRSLDPGAFGGAPAMPMLHGHPVAGAGPHAAINLGFQKFHYSLAEVRAAITARGVNADAMAGGVGIHRW